MVHVQSKACDNLTCLFTHLCSARRVAALVTQLGMSHAQMAASNRPTNAPNRDPSNTSSVKTKVIVAGATASGKIAHAPGTRRDASHAGMGTRTRQPLIAPTTIDRFHANAVTRRQIVSCRLILYLGSDLKTL